MAEQSNWQETRELWEHGGGALPLHTFFVHAAESLTGDSEEYRRPTSGLVWSVCTEGRTEPAGGSAAYNTGGAVCAPAANCKIRVFLRMQDGQAW